MASGFGAQTTGRIELKFPEVVEAGLGTGKRGKFKKAILETSRWGFGKGGASLEI